MGRMIGELSWKDVKEELGKLTPAQIVAQVVCGFALATALFWALFPLMTF